MRVPRGFALLPVLFLVILIASIGVVFLSETLRETSDVNFEEARIRAFELAETGLLRAEMELRGGIDPDGDGSGTLLGSFAGGTFNVTATPVTGSSTDFVLFSVGRFRLAVRRLEVGVRKMGNSLFPYALFGKDSVEFGSGGATDSYDGRLGNWSTQITGADASGNFADPTGSIGSNGWIKLSGATTIRGDATPGPFDIVENGNVTGSRSPRAEDLDVPDTPYEDFHAAYLTNNNGSLNLAQPDVTFDATTGSLKLDGTSHIDFTGGTYFFSDFTFGSNATITVSGPTRLYLTGGVKLQGTWTNVSGQAGDMVIFNHPYALPSGFPPPGTQLTSDGGWNSAMAIYAPALHVEMKGGGDLFGAAVAKSIKFGSTSQFHYDRSLEDFASDGGASTERLYWMER